MGAQREWRVRDPRARRRGPACQSVRTAMALGCVIEMEMSQSAAAVVCHFYPVFPFPALPNAPPLFAIVWMGASFSACGCVLFLLCVCTR